MILEKKKIRIIETRELDRAAFSHYLDFGNFFYRGDLIKLEDFPETIGSYYYSERFALPREFGNYIMTKDHLILISEVPNFYA